MITGVPYAETLVSPRRHINYLVNQDLQIDGRPETTGNDRKRRFTLGVYPDRGTSFLSTPEKQ